MPVVANVGQPQIVEEQRKMLSDQSDREPIGSSNSVKNLPNQGCQGHQVPPVQ